MTICFPTLSNPFVCVAIACAGEVCYNIVPMVKKVLLAICCLAWLPSVRASWWWPFGSNRDEAPKRMAELLEPASRLIDQAVDFAETGENDKAVAKYREALEALDRLEREHPDRAATSEFATVRNKRAYITVAIDSLMLEEARRNARTVAVTDPSGLERRFAEERSQATAEKAKKVRGPAAPAESVATNRPVAAAGPVRAESPSGDLAELPRAERLRMAAAAIGRSDYPGALAIVNGVLKDYPNDAHALNLRAVAEMNTGNKSQAEATLTQLVNSNPRAYFGYYNLARLIMATRGESGKEAARRYYRHGREYCNGPANPELEALLK